MFTVLLSKLYPRRAAALGFQAAIAYAWLKYETHISCRWREQENTTEGRENIKGKGEENKSRYCYETFRHSCSWEKGLLSVLCDIPNLWVDSITLYLDQSRRVSSVTGRPKTLRHIYKDVSLAALLLTESWSTSRGNMYRSYIYKNIESDFISLNNGALIMPPTIQEVQGMRFYNTQGIITETWVAQRQAIMYSSFWD